MKPEHLPLIKTLSAPSLHPDGNRAVIGVTRPDLSVDGYLGQLWEVRLDDLAEPRRITRGFRDTAPKYSPDGKALAFLRTNPGDAPQLYLVEAQGGEPQQLTDQKLGVESFRWSPDSRRIVFASAVPQEGRYGTVEGVAAGAEDPRLISGYKYRLNGAGFVVDKLSQIFELEVPQQTAEPLFEPRGRAKQGAENEPFKPFPEARQLTDDALTHSQPRYSAQGERIYFIGERLDSADGCLELYSMTAEGHELTQLNNQPFDGFSVMNAVESKDGKWLFVLGEELSSSGTDFVASQVGIYLRSATEPFATESGAWRRLSDATSRDFGESPDLIPWGEDSVLAVERSRGAGRLVRISAQGELEDLLDEQLLITGLDAVIAAHGDDPAIVLSLTDSESFGDLAVLTGQGLNRLTDFSREFRDQAGLIPAEEQVFSSSDGYPVHGWVLLPEGEGPHPVLLNIHGGPFAQYGWGLFDEAQVYASAGYAVVMCNPRGSGGYGYQHARAIKGQMGTVDLADVLGFLEGALAEYPQLDSSRLGVMGGSYGGYLTAWTISQDQRFRAAIVERGYLDPVSFVGSSDIGWIFPSEYNGTDAAAIAAQSPMAHLAKVQTPTFVIHSEEDWRCPIEQAQRYFVGLKKLGVETELLIFPGENHELSRSGLPQHRKQRFEHILRWWSRYLPTEQNQAVVEI
ncbi:S9 family peptidase [Psychromicrobium sp. YIM B11713]|uniref:S9 family peptidase n=1 Tax=Psychromicrobium sp. YIM B11713 TaxID=3145233 RepID=UPI00374E7634